MAQEKFGCTDPEDLIFIQEQINKAIHSGKKRWAVAKDLTKACLGFPPFDCVWLWTHQAATGEMNLDACTEVKSGLYQMLSSQDDNTTVATHLLVGHEIVVGWEEVWGDQAIVFKESGFNQVGVLPLKSGSTSIGAIGFASREKEPFCPPLLTAMRHTARHYGASLEILEMKKKLGAAGANMAQVLDALDDPIFIVDQSGKILSSNYSLNGDNQKNRNIDAILPGGNNLIQQNLEQLPLKQDSGKSKLKPGRLLGENRSQVPVEVSVKKGIWDGQEACFISCRDITSQLVVEKERDRLVTAIEQTADSIVITNSAGSIQYTNPAFSKLTGYTAEEVLGANPRILKSSQHSKDFYRKMWSTIRRGETWNGRMINRKKTGEEFCEVTSISPVLDTSGVITHYVCVKRDVTNEMKLEERLRHSQKLEAIGTLAGGIAHDFNNILYALLGNSQLALDDIAEDHPAHLPLTEIVKAGERGSALVAKMLAFGQRPEKQMKVCSLVPIIKEAMDLSRASLPSTISIQMELAADSSEMMLDEAQIHQVIINLCGNAAHAMKETGGVLTLNLDLAGVKENTPENLLGVTAGKYLRLSVSDTGCGMDSAVMTRIFEPFFTTKNPNEGAGLGLASVHGIVRNHNGHIFVDSVPAEGSTFTLYFPSAEKVVVPEEIKITEDSQLKGQGRVMVVDDEQMITDVVVRGLSKKGFQVEGFVDGIEALEVFRKDPYAFDVVITDQTMPNITGFELATHLSSIRPDLPIILSTGYSNAVYEKDFRMSGVSHFLSKPLRISELTSLICEINKSSALAKEV